MEDHDGDNDDDTEAPGISRSQGIEAEHISADDYGYVEKRMPLRRPRLAVEKAPATDDKPTESCEQSVSANPPEEDANSTSVVYKGKGKGKGKSSHSTETSEDGPMGTTRQKRKRDEDVPGVAQEDGKKEEHQPGQTNDGRVTRSGRSTGSTNTNTEQPAGEKRTIIYIIM